VNGVCLKIAVATNSLFLGETEEDQMADKLYQVSADHVEEKYRANKKVVSVHEHQGKFSAEANPYGGRGTEFDTPEKAIRSLLGDNGCTNIRIEYGPDPER
jgi:hypothetical protein